MKKTGIIIGILITFLFLFLLQGNFFNWFTIAGISPNLFILLALFVGLFAGKYMGLGLGITTGLLLDLFVGRKIGVSAIMLGVVGILGGILDKNFSKDSRFTIMLMVVCSTFLYELGAYLLNVWLLSMNIEIGAFLKITLIEMLYNAIIVIILYPLLQKIGYAIENAIKPRGMLTRYF